MLDINVGEFKAKCLALMQQVADTGEPLTVLKHGKPLVTLTPAVANKSKTLFGLHQGQGWIDGDLDDALSDIAWDVLQ